MSRLLRLAVVAGLAVWAWRIFARRRGLTERANVAYADGSSIVLDAGSPGFERLAAITRRTLEP